MLQATAKRAGISQRVASNFYKLTFKRRRTCWLLLLGSSVGAAWKQAHPHLTPDRSTGATPVSRKITPAWETPHRAHVCIRLFCCWSSSQSLVGLEESTLDSSPGEHPHRSPTLRGDLDPRVDPPGLETRLPGEDANHRKA